MDDVLVTRQKHTRFKPSADQIIDLYKRQSLKWFDDPSQPILLRHHCDCECSMDSQNRFGSMCLHCKNIYRLSNLQDTSFMIESGKYKHRRFHTEITQTIPYWSVNDFPRHIISYYEDIKHIITCEPSFSIRNTKWIQTDAQTNSYLVRLCIHRVMHMEKNLPYSTLPLALFQCNSNVTQVNEDYPFYRLTDYLDHETLNVKKIRKIVFHLILFLRSLRSSGFVFDTPSLSRFVLHNVKCMFSLHGFEDEIHSSKTLYLHDTTGCSISVSDKAGQVYRVSHKHAMVDSDMSIRISDIHIESQYVCLHESSCSTIATYRIENKESLETLLRLKQYGVPMFFSSFDSVLLLLELFTHPRVWAIVKSDHLLFGLMKYMFFFDSPHEFHQLMTEMETLSESAQRKDDILSFILNKKFICNAIQLLWECITEEFVG